MGFCPLGFCPHGIFFLWDFFPTWDFVLMGFYPDTQDYTAFEGLL